MSKCFNYDSMKLSSHSERVELNFESNNFIATYIIANMYLANYLSQFIAILNSESGDRSIYSKARRHETCSDTNKPCEIIMAAKCERHC